MPLSSSSQTKSPAVDDCPPAPEAVGARDVDDDAERAAAAGRSGTIRPDVAAPATSATRELFRRKSTLVSGDVLSESGWGSGGGGGGRGRRADGGAVVVVSDESSVGSAWEGMPRKGSRGGALASKDIRIAVVATFGPGCNAWPPSAPLPRREGISLVEEPAELEEALPKYRPVKALQPHSPGEGACDTDEEGRKEYRVLAAAAMNATAAESLLATPPAVAAAQATFCRVLPRRQHNTTAVVVAQLLVPLARCLTRR